MEKVLEKLDKTKNNCRNKIQKEFTVDIMIEKFEKIIDEAVEQEINNKNKVEADYSTYSLALELLHKNYYYCCKEYIEQKFGIYYDEDHDTKKKKKITKFGKRMNDLFIRCGAKGNIRVILDFGRAIKRTSKEAWVAFKFFIKSIIACMKIVYKLLFIRHG